MARARDSAYIGVQLQIARHSRAADVGPGFRFHAGLPMLGQERSGRQQVPVPDPSVEPARPARSALRSAHRVGWRVSAPGCGERSGEQRGYPGEPENHFFPRERTNDVDGLIDDAIPISNPPPRHALNTSRTSPGHG